MLYSYEIQQLSSNASLVVLSACETGLGNYQDGEGIQSLAYSFMYAGASSTIRSLWKLEDQSTSTIIQSFYKHLTQRKNKSASLQSAKQDYLLNADPISANPFYWAGLVLNGGEEGLYATSDRISIWWGLLLLIPLFLFGGGRRYRRMVNS